MNDAATQGLANGTTSTAQPVLLFVDDEEELLAGLRLQLRRERGRWQMHFCVGGAAGLELLRRQNADVVVSDMRMPGMDGASFLTAVRAAQPGTTRIVLSGQADEQLALRALPVAHRWLCKPCSRELLVATVEQAIESQRLLRRQDLRALVGRATSIPSIPRLYEELMHRLTQPDFGAGEIADFVGRDPGMAAKVLQLANSSLFGRGRPLHALPEAVTLLGLRTLTHLLLAAEVFTALADGARDEPELAGVERRAAAVSALTGRLLDVDHDAAALGSTAGLLHEVGTLVLLQHDPTGFARTRTEAQGRGVAPHVVETERYGATHAEVAAMLLGTWGLPMDLVDLMAHHHDPARWPAPDGVHAALCIAECVVATPWLWPQLRAQLQARVPAHWLPMAEGALPRR